MYVWFMLSTLWSPFAAAIQSRLFSSARKWCELVYRIRSSNATCHGGSGTPLAHVGLCVWLLVLLLSSCGNTRVLVIPSLQSRAAISRHNDIPVSGLHIAGMPDANGSARNVARTGRALEPGTSGEAYKMQIHATGHAETSVNMRLR